jgi:gluconokinase
MVVILMGVSGAGKTAVGDLLASRLGWAHFDADDFHPQSNIRKMSAGRPLTDEDRDPWLASIRARIDRLERAGINAIIGCSALKEKYRQQLMTGTRDTRLVYLRGSRALIEWRLRQRQGHFFDPDLLASQFEALEEPTVGIVVDIDQDLDSVTTAVARALEVEVPDSSEEE